MALSHLWCHRCPRRWRKGPPSEVCLACTSESAIVAGSTTPAAWVRIRSLYVGRSSDYFSHRVRHGAGDAALQDRPMEDNTLSSSSRSPTRATPDQLTRTSRFLPSDQLDSIEAAWVDASQ